MITKGIFVATVVTVVCRILRVHADANDDLYNSIFRYSTQPMTPMAVRGALDSLCSDATGFPLTDPRRYEVFLWRLMAILEESKCNRVHNDMIQNRLRQCIAIANQHLDPERQSGHNLVLNLITYVEDSRTNILTYCEGRLGVPFVNALKSVTQDRYKFFFKQMEIFRYPVTINVHEMGRTIGRIIHAQASKDDYDMVSQLGIVDHVIQVYEKHSPCSAVMRIFRRYEQYYELITETSNYMRLSGESRQWINRVRVCHFIDQNEQVFGIASNYLLDKERDAESSESAAFATVLNYRYDSIFRLSHQKKTLAGIQISLIKLDSYRTGLAAFDSRREHVHYWLNASMHDRSQCNKQADDDLRSQLELHRTEAEQNSEGAQQLVSDSFFNLEIYFEYVRSERLMFCEFVCGTALAKELDQLDADDVQKLDALTIGFRCGREVDVVELGRRVGEIIIAKSYRSEDHTAIDLERLKDVYETRSPCSRLLDIASRYDNYYGLVTSSGGYDKLRPALRSWIDKIWVCKFIENSPQVFEEAGMTIPARYGV